MHARIEACPRGPIQKILWLLILPSGLDTECAVVTLFVLVGDNWGTIGVEAVYVWPMY